MNGLRSVEHCAAGALMTLVIFTLIGPAVVVVAAQTLLHGPQSAGIAVVPVPAALPIAGALAALVCARIARPFRLAPQASLATANEVS